MSRSAAGDAKWRWRRRCATAPTCLPASRLATKTAACSTNSTAAIAVRLLGVYLLLGFTKRTFPLVKGGRFRYTLRLSRECWPHLSGSGGTIYHESSGHKATRGAATQGSAPI